MASGAAMACEDAATFRKVLQSTTKENLGAALQQYQKLRQPRASTLQKFGRKLQSAYHLPNGKEQEDRDYWMTQDDERNPIFWGYKERRDWLFGHDAELF
jgi:salicylate hydroxylase